MTQNDSEVLHEGQSVQTEQARAHMIEGQIRAQGVLEDRVLATLCRVQREHFVAQAYKSWSFADVELPLPGGARMLRPFLEASILQAVMPPLGTSAQRALLVGLGSGYLAALLATVATRVVALDVQADTLSFAQQQLQANAVHNVDTLCISGEEGWAQEQPYDIIVFTASLPRLVPSIASQLTLGGRLWLVCGESPVMTAYLVTRLQEDVYKTNGLFETCIAPLIVRKKMAKFSL